MAISEKLLELLVCPENKTSLRKADDSLLQRINNAISAGTLKNRVGATVSEKIDSGLVREDGRYLYIVREDIPIMLIDEAIPLSE